MDNPIVKYRILIISHVKPFPRNSGQQVRVYSKLISLRRYFHITFLTFEVTSQIDDTRRQLANLVDHAIVIPSMTNGHIGHKVVSGICATVKGLKNSNYVIGSVEFSKKRIKQFVNVNDYDLVLYEYWHAHNSTEIFREKGIPCVLDMHDLLWQSYARQLSVKAYPDIIQQLMVDRYKRYEEAAWQDFDALIAISEGEGDYVSNVLPDRPLFVAPMGIDMQQWPQSWDPVQPPRLAFYGGLGSQVNQASALRCVQSIMPLIWEHMPYVEFWVIGSKPPEHIKALMADSRVHVTGFVPDVASVLKTMTAVLCPWTGMYGFRSRIIEVMALGVPVVASPDAVHGMGLVDGAGILLKESNGEIATKALSLLQDHTFARVQSDLACQQVKRQFSFEATYGQLSQQLYEFVK